MEVSKEHIMSRGKGGFKISPYLQTKMCYVGQKEVFREGCESLLELMDLSISAKQIENVCHYWGEDLGILMEEKEMEVTEKSEDLHYVMIDGAMILSREPSWKEVKLGRIFMANNLYSIGTEPHPRGWIRQSNYTAHLGNCHDFFDKFTTKVDRLINFICIGDGAKWIWEWCSAHYPDAVQILDYWHAVEHFWKFIKLYFKEATAQQAWIEEKEALLWDDQIEQVIQDIEAMEHKNKKVMVEKQALISYLKNNQSRMLYGTFKEKGWLVGSGAIESAHRTVIQKRLKLSGQRWTIKGAQQILNLRVAHKNNNWDDLVQLIAA